MTIIADQLRDVLAAAEASGSAEAVLQVQQQAARAFVHFTMSREDLHDILNRAEAVLDILAERV